MSEVPETPLRGQFWGSDDFTGGGGGREKARSSPQQLRAEENTVLEVSEREEGKSAKNFESKSRHRCASLWHILEVL